MMSKRLCVDLRRDVSCGVGRSAYCTAKALEPECSKRSIQVVALLSPETAFLEGEFPSATIVASDAKYFTNADLVGLPGLVAAHADAFWSNQFYISPHFTVPVVTMIHDLWPVLYPDWLPNHEEVATRHGPGVVDCARRMVALFESTTLERMGHEVQRTYQCRQRLADRFMIAMMLMAADRAKFIATCSEYSRSLLAEFLPDLAGKLHVVSPFPTFGNPNEPVAPRSAPLDVVELLNVAKFDPRKNHEFLVDSLALLQSCWKGGAKIRVHFVGEIGYRSFGASLMQKAIKLILPPHEVVFHDLISDRELLELYRRCHLLVMPSLDEGFGLPLLEALSVGMPVLAARRGALPEVAGAFAYLSELGSPEQFAAEIRAAIEQYPASAQIALEGRFDIHRRYCRERTSREVETILDQLFE